MVGDVSWLLTWGRVEHSGDALHGQAFPGFTIKLIHKFASLVTSAYKVAAVARDNFDRTSPSVDHLRQGVKDVASTAHAIPMWMSLDRRYVQGHMYLFRSELLNLPSQMIHHNHPPRVHNQAGGNDLVYISG